MDTYLSDNSGNRAAPGAVNADPVAASGQLLTDAAIGADITITVKPGQTYIVTASITGGFQFGVAAVTTDANVMWVCPLHQTIMIKIPLGISTLHYEGDTNGATGWIRELQPDVQA